LAGTALDARLRVGSVTGRYVLGEASSVLGVNVFACRLRSVSSDSFVAAAPVVGELGDWVTASFTPFGTLHGRIEHHVDDGFVVQLAVDRAERKRLAQRIMAYRGRVWRGAADHRVADRFMPAEPRSVILPDSGGVYPCLVVDFSSTGAAVSAAINPPVGTRVTIGQVAAEVVRLFDVGFAVRFDPLPQADDVERLLEAPEEWRDAVAVLTRKPLDSDQADEVLEVYGYD